MAVQRFSAVSVLLFTGGAVEGHCQCRLCMQVSVLKEVVLSGSDIKEEAVARCVVCPALRRPYTSCECYPRLLLAREVSLTTPLDSV